MESLISVTWVDETTGRYVLVKRSEQAKNIPPSYLEYTEARNAGKDYDAAKFIKSNILRYRPRGPHV